MIYVQPSSIKDFFCQNRQRLCNEAVLIAEDEPSGVQIYLTTELGLPYFTVDIDGSTEYDDLTTVPELEKDYEKLISQYMTSPADQEVSQSDTKPKPEPESEEPSEDYSGEEYYLTIALIEELLGVNIEDTCLEPRDVTDLLESFIDLLGRMI